MRLAPGTILRDKYQIVRKVGADEHAAGEVFEARHLDLAGRYAIKFVCEGGIRNALLLDELRREALATSVLSHPGIVRVYDLDQAPDGSPFIVMEFLSGQDLGRVIGQRGPMALSDVAAIVEAIASPLGEAHRRGIFHGDLTPANVFVLDAEADTHARVKLLDFGVASIRARAGGLVREADAQAAPEYAAPERQRGRAWEVDERTDVFALGAIAYALVSGRTRFAPTPAGDLPPLAAPPAVATAVARATSKGREGRFRSVGDFAQAFRAAVSASPARASGVRTTRLGLTPAVPVATLHQPTDRVRLPSGLWKSAAAAAACGLAILVAVVVFTRSKPQEAARLPSEAPRASAPPRPAPAALAPAPAPVPAVAVVPAPAAPSVARPVAARDVSRQPLPPRDGAEGDGHHRRRSAHAGMTDAARHEMEQSYQTASRAFDIGNYDDAIVAYKHAYELGGDAPMLYNIAQALRLSNRPDEAVVYYRRYLDRAPTASNRDDVRAKIAELSGQSPAPSTTKATAVAARSPFDCHWPEHAIPGKAIEVSCADADPRTPVAKAFLLYRVTGAGAFSPVEMPRAAPGSYKVSIPEPAVSPRGLEIYFEGRRTTGETVTQNGSASRPNGIVVAQP